MATKFRDGLVYGTTALAVPLWALLTQSLYLGLLFGLASAGLAVWLAEGYERFRERR